MFLYEIHRTVYMHMYLNQLYYNEVLYNAIPIQAVVMHIFKVIYKMETTYTHNLLMTMNPEKMDCAFSGI